MSKSITTIIATTLLTGVLVYCLQSRVLFFWFLVSVAIISMIANIFEIEKQKQPITKLDCVCLLVMKVVMLFGYIKYLNN